MSREPLIPQQAETVAQTLSRLPDNQWTGDEQLAGPDDVWHLWASAGGYVGYCGVRPDVRYVRTRIGGQPSCMACIVKVRGMAR